METFMGLFLVGGLLGLAIVLHILKMGAKRIFGYDLYFDLALSFFLMVMFHGTQAGMVYAIFGGLIISVFLRVGRWVFGYQRLALIQIPIKIKIFGKLYAEAGSLPRLAWKEYPSLSAKKYTGPRWVNPDYRNYPCK